MPERSPEGVALALRRVCDRIHEACRRSGRDPMEVRLVGATKGVPPEVIRWAIEGGLSEFAENYARELVAKAVSMPARWHFVGKLQAGTARVVAAHCDVVHSAEPGSGLVRLAARADRQGRAIDCLAQVDFTGRRQGVGPEDLEPFLADASTLRGIRLVGLMTLPPPGQAAEEARPFFARLRALRERLVARWPDLRELSMGMSSDYEVAVEEGATMVRIGTALFGRRPRKRST